MMLKEYIYYDLQSLTTAIAHFSKCYKPEVQNIQPTTAKYKTARLSVGFKTYFFYAIPKGKGWFEGDFQSISKAGISFSLRFNLTKGLSFGTGFGTYNKHLIANDTFILNHSENVFGSLVKGLPNIIYRIYEIPMEINYRFVKVKSSFKPTISLGVSYIIISTPKLKSGGYSHEKPKISTYVATNSFITRPIKDYSLYVAGALNKTLSKNAYLEFGVKYSMDSEKYNSDPLPPTGDIYNDRNTALSTRRIELNLSYFLYLGRNK